MGEVGVFFGKFWGVDGFWLVWILGCWVILILGVEDVFSFYYTEVDLVLMSISYPPMN